MWVFTPVSSTKTSRAWSTAVRGQNAARLFRRHAILRQTADQRKSRPWLSATSARTAPSLAKRAARLSQTASQKSSKPNVDQGPNSIVRLNLPTLMM
jgi:hypothetical protein